MPHLVLEYTANLLPAFNPTQALRLANTALIASGHFEPDHIKSRAIALDDYLVGAGEPCGFIHARLHLLSGRDTATKTALTAALVEALQSCAHRTDHLPVQITAEALDLDRSTYSKAVVQG